MIVVADTSPINFLVLIGEQDILAALFGRVIIPKAVYRELEAAATPAVVRKWIGSQPRWIEIRIPTWVPDPTLSHLDEGEREAIQLVEELRADLLLVDERAGRREARKRKLITSGTLGVLDRAAEKGLVDFLVALQKLKQTSFYISPSVERFFATVKRGERAAKKLIPSDNKSIRDEAEAVYLDITHYRYGWTFLSPLSRPMKLSLR